MKLFTSRGIFGSSEKLFTNDFCRQLGYVFGYWLELHHQPGYISLANSPLPNIDRIKKQLIIGLSSSNWLILDEGVQTLPVLAKYTATTPHVVAGIYIAADNLRSDEQTIHLFISGEEIDTTAQNEISDLFYNLTSPANPVGESQPIVTEDKAYQQYCDDVVTQFASLSRLRVIVDTANGSASRLVKDLFSRLNLDFSCTTHCEPQSTEYIATHASNHHRLSEISSQIVSQGADIGIAFDITGENVQFIDHLGQLASSEQILCLFANHLPTPSVTISPDTSDIVNSISLPTFRPSSLAVSELITQMNLHASSLGLDRSSGFIFANHVLVPDGVMAALKLLHLITNSSQSLHELLSAYPKSSFASVYIDCSPSQYTTIQTALQNHYPHLKAVSQTLYSLENSQHTIQIVFSDTHGLIEIYGPVSLLHQVSNFIKDTLHSEKSSLPNTQINDTLGILPSIISFPSQCHQVLTDVSQIAFPPACALVKNVVISGMGGSALGGRVLSSLERLVLKVPLIISTEYNLPNFVDSNSLVVISSYSGNTAETVSAFHEARSRGAQMFVLAAGGQLADLATKYQVPSYIFDTTNNPSGQPRMGLGYNILALAALLARCGLIHPIDEINRLPQFLTSQQQQSYALRDLASRFHERIPILVASEHLKGAAIAMRNQLNENSKTFAVFFDLPELNHHLLEGLTYPLWLPNRVAFLFIESSSYHPDIQVRYPLTREVVTKHHIPAHTLNITGPNKFFESLNLIQSGALFAYHLSQINGVDPGPIPWVDWYKDQLAKL